MRVTIHECKEDGRDLTHEARTTCEVTAITRAVRKHFGPGAYFYRDQGIGVPGHYGQIVRNLPNNGGGWSANCLTGRVRIDVV